MQHDLGTIGPGRIADLEHEVNALEAYLGYDEKNLYAVFVCFDDPAKVRARMSRREDIFDDDTVEIMLDTFHDRRKGDVAEHPRNEDRAADRRPAVEPGPVASDPSRALECSSTTNTSSAPAASSRRSRA